MSDSDDASTGKVRQRVGMACAYCRYRKIKCDGAERCKNCVRTRRVCEYVPVPETAKNERADARSRAAVVAGVVVPAAAHGKGAAGRRFSLSPKGKDQKAHGGGAPTSSTSARKQPRTAALTRAAILPGPLTTTAIIPRGSVSSSSGALDDDDSDADAEGEVDTGDESDEAFVAATTSHSHLSASAPSSSSSRIVRQPPNAAPSYLANIPVYDQQSQPQSQSYLVRRPSLAQHRHPSVASSSASSGDSPPAPPTPLLISTTAAPTLHSHQSYNDYHNQHIHQHSHQQQPFQPANIQKHGGQEHQRQQAASHPVPSAQAHHLQDQDDALGLKLSVTGWESVLGYNQPPPQQPQQQQSLLYQPWACPPSFDQPSLSQDSYFPTAPYQQQQQQQAAYPSRPTLPTRSISISHPSQRHQPYPSPYSGAAGYQPHRASFSSSIHSTPAAPFDGRPGLGPAAHYHRASSSSYHGPSSIAAAACSSSVDPYGLFSASTAASYDSALGGVSSPPPSAPQQQQTASSSSSIPFNSSASADLSALFQGLVPDDDDDEDTDDAGVDGGVGDLGGDWGEGMMLGVEMDEHRRAAGAAYSGGAGASLGLGLEFSEDGSDLPWAQGADVGLLY